jgi:hypothetical protein
MIRLLLLVSTPSMQLVLQMVMYAAHVLFAMRLSLSFERVVIASQIVAQGGGRSCCICVRYAEFAALSTALQTCMQYEPTLIRFNKQGNKPITAHQFLCMTLLAGIPLGAELLSFAAHPFPNCACLPGRKVFCSARCDIAHML